MDIRRDIIADFKQWKDSPQRKPILLQGARQIGKTWVMEAFGKECFEQYARFDFDRQPELKSVFQVSKSPERIIKELALYCDVPLIAGKTLLIFDEIQECEEALNSLKYFCEEAPQYHIIAAGSLLGVAVKRRRMTVPVGKVRVMRMYPVSFREFLRVSDEQTFEYVEGIESPTHLPEIILNKLKLEYRRYMICGGMPEAPREIPRIRAIWHSLPSQLGKENRKFIFKVIKTGARSKDYEDSLLWLEDAGMIYRINNVSKPGMPLKAYEEPDAFKVYACDCGLLRQLAHLPASTIMDSSSNYTEFKGAMAENAVLQSLMPMMNNQMPNYWSPDSKAELELLIQWKDEIIPIEVKAENCISGRSLSVYNDKYHPLHRIRFSFLNLQLNGGLLSCPSPLAEWFWKWI